MVGCAGGGVACAVLNIAGVKVVSLTSLWLFFALSAPFVAIVVLAPFKMGALANAVTKPTTSSVDILGGLLICMWNYMGWDNASTIATEVEKPQRTYPRAMLVAVAIVALSYVLPFAAMWMTGLTSDRLGDWLLGRHRGLAGRTAAAHRRSARRHDQRFWHVQRAGDELFAPAVGHGAGWHVARRFRQAAEEVARALGCDYRAGHGWAMCLGLGFARLVTLDILLYGFSLLLEFMALIVLRFREPDLAASLPCSRRIVWSDRDRHPAHAAAWLSPSIRSEHEQVWNMSSFAFGMILIAAGLWPTSSTMLLKPQGWAAQAQPKPNPQPKQISATDLHGFTRIWLS